jgi:hypothetical protein
MLITPPSLKRPQAIEAALRLMQPIGSGFNNSLMPVACALRNACLSYDAALGLAYQRAATFGDTRKCFHEIGRAFRKVFKQDGRDGHRGDVAATKFDFTPDFRRIEEICSSGITVQQLRNVSPVDPRTLTSWEIIKKLFPDRKTLICIGWSPESFMVTRRDQEMHLDQCQFLVPSPMIDYVGVSQEGRLSAHCLANTAARLWLVTEWDFRPYNKDGSPTVWRDLIRTLDESRQAVNRTSLNMCASLIGELEQYAPTKLGMVVFSGGVSLQAWWPALDEDRMREFFQIALRLGACRSGWTRSQFFRMPNGTRQNEDGSTAAQPVYYLNL